MSHLSDKLFSFSMSLYIFSIVFNRLLTLCEDLARTIETKHRVHTARTDDRKARYGHRHGDGEIYR